MHNNHRSGSSTIEFALLLPIFVAILATSFDYAYYFYIRALSMDAVRAGCRIGAVSPPEATGTPEQLAAGAIQDFVGQHQFFGIDCVSESDPRCQVNVQTQGSAPTAYLVCTATMTYPGLTGAVPMPETIVTQTIQQLEIQ